jgi:hypothetical protein
MQFFPVEVNFHFYFNSYFFSSVTTGFYFRTFQPRFYEFIKFRLIQAEGGFVNYSDFRNFSGLAFPTNFFNPTYFTSQFSTQALFESEAFENSFINFSFFDFENFNDFYFVSFFNEFDEDFPQSHFFPYLSSHLDEEYFSNESPGTLMHAFHSKLLDFSKTSGFYKGCFGPRAIRYLTYQSHYPTSSATLFSLSNLFLFDFDFLFFTDMWKFKYFNSSFLFSSSFKTTVISKKNLIKMESFNYLIHRKFLDLLQSQSIDREEWLYERHSSRRFRFHKNSKFKISRHSSDFFRFTTKKTKSLFFYKSISQRLSSVPAVSSMLFRTKSFRRFTKIQFNFSSKLFRFLKYINATTRFF